jgi:hypothetical protein
MLDPDLPPEIPPDPTAGIGTLRALVHAGAAGTMHAAHIAWEWIWFIAHLALPLLTMAFLVWFYRNYAELAALASFLVRRAFERMQAGFLRWWAARAARGEWHRYSRRTDAQIRQEIDRLRARAERHYRIADVLMETAGNAVSPAEAAKARLLDGPIARRFARRNALNAAADRIECLAAEIAKARELQLKEQTRRQAIGLIDRLETEDAGAAEAALAELNTIGPQIDWDSIIPAAIPQPARPRLMKILRQMAGTSSLGEARNAKTQADNIIRTHGVSWERMAA